MLLRAKLAAERGAPRRDSEVSILLNLGGLILVSVMMGPHAAAGGPGLGSDGKLSWSIEGRDLAGTVGRKRRSPCGPELGLVVVVVVVVVVAATVVAVVDRFMGCCFRRELGEGEGWRGQIPSCEVRKGSPCKSK